MKKTCLIIFLAVNFSYAGHAFSASQGFALQCIQYSVLINDKTEDNELKERRDNGAIFHHNLYLEKISDKRTLSVLTVNPSDGALVVLNRSVEASNIKFDWYDSVLYKMDKDFGYIIIGKSPWTRKLSQKMKEANFPSSGEYRMKAFSGKDPQNYYHHCKIVS